MNLSRTTNKKILMHKIMYFHHDAKEMSFTRSGRLETPGPRTDYGKERGLSEVISNTQASSEIRKTRGMVLASVRPSQNRVP